MCVGSIPAPLKKDSSAGRAIDFEPEKFKPGLEIQTPADGKLL